MTIDGRSAGLQVSYVSATAPPPAAPLAAISTAVPVYPAGTSYYPVDPSRLAAADTVPTQPVTGRSKPLQVAYRLPSTAVVGRSKPLQVSVLKSGPVGRSAALQVALYRSLIPRDYKAGGVRTDLQFRQVIGGQLAQLRVRRGAIRTYPRSFGDYGTYMPSTATAGLPAEFASGLVPYYGNLTVTDPEQPIDMLDIHGRLIFQVPYLARPAQRFIVRGYPAASVAGPTPLIDCTWPGIKQPIVMQDFTVRPDEPSEFTVGIDGHHWTAIRPYLVDLQDGYRARNDASGVSNTSLLWALIDWLTYYRIPSSRATSLQTHNDCGQLIGCNGHVIRGSLYFARYGSRGQYQPGILDNTGVLYGANNDHPETADLQINVAGNGDKVQNLEVYKSWMLGGFYPINGGDTGNDGTLANPWVLGRVTDCWADAADKHGSPPYWINLRAQQALVDERNYWMDGARAGQLVAYRGGSAGAPPAATLAAISSAAPVYPTGASYYPVDRARITLAGETQPATPPAAASLSPVSTAAPVYPAGSSYYPVDAARIVLDGQAPTDTSRPAGPGYVTYESLVQPGDTVTEALARLTTPDIVTFPAGRFEFLDFNTGFQAGMTVPPICRGIIGSGTGTIGSSTGTVFTIKAMSSTKGNGATYTKVVNGVSTQVLYVPPDGSSDPNQLNMMKHYPEVGNNPVFKNFRIEGTPQGHSYHGMQIVSSANAPTVQDVLITGCVGTKGYPPEETFSLQFTGGIGPVARRVEVDGRQTAGGVPTAAVGITMQNSVGGLIDVCTVRYCRAAAAVGYQSFNLTITGGLYDSASAGSYAIGNGGLNFEQTSGTRIIGANIIGRSGMVHFTFSNGTYTRTVGGISYTTANGTIEFLDCTWNPQNANNSYFYGQTWNPYYLGSTTNINSMTYPGAVGDDGSSADGPSGAPWVHNSDGSAANLLWIFGQLRQLNPTPNARAAS